MRSQIACKAYRKNCMWQSILKVNFITFFILCLWVHNSFAVCSLTSWPLYVYVHLKPKKMGLSIIPPCFCTNILNGVKDFLEGEINLLLLIYFTRVYFWAAYLAKLRQRNSIIPRRRNSAYFPSFFNFLNFFNFFNFFNLLTSRPSLVRRFTTLLEK